MANKIYQIEELGRRWAVADPMDESLTLDGLAALSVRQGDQWDRGASARPTRYLWRLVLDGFATNPVIGESVLLYIAGSNGIDHDADLGVSDAAATVDQLLNCRQIGSVQVMTTSTFDIHTGSGLVDIFDRYVTPVIFNRTNDALASAGTPVHYLELTPVSDEIQ